MADARHGGQCSDWNGYRLGVCRLSTSIEFIIQNLLNSVEPIACGCHIEDVDLDLHTPVIRINRIQARCARASSVINPRIGGGVTRKTCSLVVLLWPSLGVKVQLGLGG